MGVDASRVKMALRRRVLQAGLRIAEALDAAFAPGPLVVDER